MSLLAAPLLAPPLKRSDKVDLKSPFRNFIFSTYGQDADNYTQAVGELQTARDWCCSGSLDKHESSIDAVTKFYDQLVAIEAKLPVGEGQIPLKYTWYDCFNRKEGFFSSSSVKQGLNSGAYERICVLFNLASVHAIVAGAQNLETDVGLKLAVKSFPMAAALFQHLRDQVFAQLPKVPTPDLSGDTAIALSALMLAQGQECFFHKATSDNMKAAIVTKVAAQAADYYGDAMRAMDNSAIRSQWDKSWLPIILGKQSYFLAMADYYDSIALKEGKKFGDQIGRLRHAVQMLQHASKQGEGQLNVSRAMDRVQRDLATAEKENNMIYNASIPQYAAMATLGRVAVAKVPPMPAHPLSGSAFKDAFEGLVPLQVHQAATEFENKRKSCVQQLCMRAKEATQNMNSELANMNLPAALEDTTGTEVPASVLEKSQGMQAAGGWQPLYDKIKALPDNLQRNVDILNDMTGSLDTEEQEDEKLRARFAGKWNRTESKKLTDNFRQEINKFNTFLSSARSADEQVKAKFESHLGSMQLLCSSPADLKAQLPSGGPSAQAGSESVLALQNMMAQWTQIRTDRERLEADVEQTTCDVKSRFLSAMMSDGAINEEATSPQILEELFASKRSNLDESLQRQEQLLFQIKASNESFEHEKSSSSAANEREKMLKSLAAAYDVFTELNANLTEGTKFYADLTTLLLQLQQKVNDLVYARNTEKEDALKELQSSIASSENAPAPAQPSYQQPAKAVPARPPPPTAAPRTQRPAPTPPTAAAAAPAVTSGFPQSAPAPQQHQQQSQPPPVAAPASSAPPPTYGGTAYNYGAPPPQQHPGGYAPPAYGGYPSYPTAGGYYPPAGAPYVAPPPGAGYPGQAPAPYQQQGAYPTQPGYPVQPGYPAQQQQQPPANPGYPTQPPTYGHPQR
ncbi:programmed cell death 6-interacting protein-like [Sycon ciliatum]|uniref:programmed cell death 6-interacting protein-like n=1 Tax=Sycon ciliatum TaxID=27933 RepID=UPI0031F6AF66